MIGGDRVKSRYIISYLARKHDVTLVTFNHGGEPTKSFRRELDKMGSRNYVIPLNPIKAGARSLFRLPGKLPLEIMFYYQKEFRDKVEELVAENDFDLGIAFFMRTAEYIKDKPFKKILMAEDCRTVYQKRSYEKSVNLKQKLIRRFEWRRLRRYEPQMMEMFDLATFVTHQDIDHIKKLNPNGEYRLISNGTEVDKFKPAGPFEERSGILFAGRLDLWANELMIRSIVRDILPRVRERAPGATFSIAGANPSPSVLALRGKNVNVYSNVPEMLPYLQSHRVFLHPHEGGSGIQNKLLEAMSAGCPVITTNIGNQGIDGESGRDLLIAGATDEFVDATVKLLTDDAFAKKISENARKLIIKNHSWDSVYEQMDSALEELFGTGAR
ncbi:MAG: glycosyltransferase [Chloroflexota bacterium]